MPSKVILRCQLILMCVALWAERTQAQGTFQNLGFEEARIVSVDPAEPYVISAAAAIPAWSAYTFGGVEPTILYNTLALDFPSVSIHDTNSSLAPVLVGQFSVRLQYSSFFKVFPAIQQTATVPSSTESLRFATDKRDPFAIAAILNGQQLGLILLGVSGGYRYIWGADVSAYAGKEAELRFQGDGVLDFITFSPVPIPEPCAVSLMLPGGIAILVSKRYRAKCHRI